MEWRQLPTGFPPVDEHLVVGESGYEILEGRLIKVPGSHWPHASRQATIGALLKVYARPPYDVAVDLLTRVSEDSDIAPDAAVLRRGVNPETGKKAALRAALKAEKSESSTVCGRRWSSS